MCSRCHSAAPALLAALALFACEREARRFHENPAPPAADEVRLSELQPGPHTADVAVRNPSERRAYSVSEGKVLYQQFNCSGCHSLGGGGIGPPLMDSDWIYGSDPENVYETIVQGRPNGMPAFGGKVTDGQVWRLVAYVRSMSGLLAKDVAPGRTDDMQVRSQEQATEKAHPKMSPDRPAGPP